MEIIEGIVNRRDAGYRNDIRDCEAQRRHALDLQAAIVGTTCKPTVVIGGLMTSTLLTLFMLPVVYKWMEARREQEYLDHLQCVFDMSKSMPKCS